MLGIRNTICILLLLLYSTSVFSQVYYEEDDREEEQEEAEEDRPLEDRLYTGGDVSLAFGTFTFIHLSPILGYEVTEKFSVGIGSTYQYISSPSFSTSVFGARVFARQFIGNQFFIHSEFEYFNIESFTSTSPTPDRIYVPVGLIGAGYAMRFGKRSYGQILLMYDLINDPNSPYANFPTPDSPLVYRGGFIIGF